MQKTNFSNPVILALVIFAILSAGSSSVFAIVETSWLGDFNGDRKVDISDLGIFCEYWLEYDCRYLGQCGGTDMDYSEDVDLVDFSWMAGVWEGMAFTSGVDLFQTTGWVDVNIPADFFEPGSQPFDGTIPLVGQYLNTAGAFELGKTDTTIFRIESVVVPPAPSEVNIPVEFSRLSLVSSAPITVTFGESPTYWDVSMTVDDENSPSENGMLELYRTNSQGGHCDMYTPVIPKLTFSRCSETRSLVLGEILLEGVGGDWQDISYSSASNLVVPRLNAALGINITLTSEKMHLNLSPASTDPCRPPPDIKPNAIIDPEVASIGRYATIHDWAYVGADVVIGPNSDIGEYSRIEEDALIGSEVSIGYDTFVGRDTIIGDGSTIGSDVIIGPYSYIGPNCVVGQDCEIGIAVHIGHDSVIDSNAFIGDLVKGGSELLIGANASISEGLLLACNAWVDHDMNLTDDLLPCSEPLGGNYVGTGYECSDVGGAVYGWSIDIPVPFPPEYPGSPPKKPIEPNSLTPVDPNDGNETEWINKLREDVNDANTVGFPPPSTSYPYDSNYVNPDPNEPKYPNSPLDPNTPIPDRPFLKIIYDCDDYASDAEKALTALGYDATFTWYVKYKKVKKWSAEKKGYVNKWEVTKNHCKLDVHKNGKMIWIEPQNGKINKEMDVDGDGNVEVFESPTKKEFKERKKHFSEDGDKDEKATIVVFESREEAEDNGFKFDPE